MAVLQQDLELVLWPLQKKTSSALSLSFSFRLLFSFSEKQDPLPRELASAGHNVTQCVPYSQNQTHAATSVGQVVTTLADAEETSLKFLGYVFATLVLQGHEEPSM